MKLGDIAPLTKWLELEQRIIDRILNGHEVLHK